MSDSFLAVEVEKNQTVIVTVPESLIISTPEKEVVVTSNGYQGIQGIQGIQGPQGLQGPQGPVATISTASDVNISGLTTGSILVYNQDVNKWVTTTNITDSINSATANNTPLTIVKRDSAGNFSAGTITATLDGTAKALTVGRTISITGDLTYTSPIFDGSVNVTAQGILATVLDGTINKVPGTFGSTEAIPIVTVDNKGRVTAVTSTPISTNLNISGNTGTDVVALGQDVLKVVGSGGVTTTVANNEVNISIGQPVGTTSNVTFNDLTLTGNLTVTGTTTSINSTNLNVTDLNITVAKGATTALSANGAGLTVEGPTVPATLTYTSNDDRWNLNKDLNVNTVYGNLNGLASKATVLDTGRTISITGDLTYTSPQFDGSANVTAQATLASVNSNVGSYGDNLNIPTITVDSKGRITAVNTSQIPAASYNSPGLASFNSNNFIVSAGVVALNVIDGGVLLPRIMLLETGDKLLLENGSALLLG